MMTSAEDKRRQFQRYAPLWADIRWLLFWLSGGIALGLYTSNILGSLIAALLL